MRFRTWLVLLSASLLMGCDQLALLSVDWRALHSFLPPDVELPLFGGRQAREILGGKSAEQLKAESHDPRIVREFLLAEIRAWLPTRSCHQPEAIAEALVRAANQFELDPVLLLAMIIQESSVNPKAVGSAGEIGLMQLKLETAKWLARRHGLEVPTRKTLFEPELNIEIGAAYLSYLRQRFKPNARRFLNAYNVGPTGLSTRTTDYHGRIKTHYHDLLDSLARIRSDIDVKDLKVADGTY